MEQRTSLLSSRRSTSISALVLDGKVPPLLLDNALIHLRNSDMMDGWERRSATSTHIRAAD